MSNGLEHLGACNAMDGGECNCGARGMTEARDRMAYFPNGTAGMEYEAEYCEKCVHYGDPKNGPGCPIFSLHVLWNYDATGENADTTKRTALELFIPRTKDGLGNEQCKMYVPREVSQDAMDPTKCNEISPSGNYKCELDLEHLGQHYAVCANPAFSERWPWPADQSELSELESLRKLNAERIKALRQCEEVYRDGTPRVEEQA